MNISANTNQNIETKTETPVVNALPVDEGVLSNVNMPFANVMEGMITQVDSSLPDVDFIFDSMTMNIEDAMFFVNLAQEGQFSVNSSSSGEFQSLMQLDVAKNVASQRTVEVTNQITSLIEKAQSTQKPVRISFDNDVSVILKIDKHGKVTAEFIPGSLEVENYLRNNIASLRQKFDEQNLPYNDLFYRQNGKQNRNKKKEKGE